MQNILKRNHMVLMLLGMAIIMTLSLPTKVSANTREDLGTYTEEDFSYDEDLGTCIKFGILLEKDGTLNIDFEDPTTVTIDGIFVKDSSGNNLYFTTYDPDKRSNMHNGFELSAGTYTVEILSDALEEGGKVKVNLYNSYDKAEVNPSFSISDKSFEIEKGDSYSLGVEAEPEDATYKTVWSSSDENVATVNKNGKVVGKGKGTAKISAAVYVNGTLYDTLTSRVKVTYEWKYSDFSKAMRECAKNNSNLFYKDIDKGRICRLYSYGSSGTVVKLKTQSFGSVGGYDFYIELKKRNDNTLSLKLYNRQIFIMFSILKEQDLDIEKFKMRSSNRIMAFDSDIVTKKGYWRSDGIYYAKTTARALISDASNIDAKIVKKFKTMLGQKSTVYRMNCGSGAWYSMSLPTGTCKSAIKLTNVYSKLAKNI